MMCGARGRAFKFSALAHAATGIAVRAREREKMRTLFATEICTRLRYWTRHFLTVCLHAVCVCVCVYNLRLFACEFNYAFVFISVLSCGGFTIIPDSFCARNNKSNECRRNQCATPRYCDFARLEIDFHLVLCTFSLHFAKFNSRVNVNCVLRVLRSPLGVNNNCLWEDRSDYSYRVYRASYFVLEWRSQPE